MEKSQTYSPSVLGMEYLRRNKKEKVRIGFPGDIIPLVTGYATRKQEHFIIVTLNAAHQVIKVNPLTKGILNRTIVHPRDVFKKAILQDSVAIIAAHNHPSGNVQPSLEHKEITERLSQRGGSTVLSAIRCTPEFFSFAPVYA